MKILLVEDDEVLSDGISIALGQCGYEVKMVANGQDAYDRVVDETFDLIILDLGLPKTDGLQVLKLLREYNKTLPVLIITARGRLQDRVVGLDLGADDYLTKPFDLPELEARVRALLRRSNLENTMDITYGPLKLDTAGRRVLMKGQPLELSHRELVMLELLLHKTGKLVNKEQIVEHMFDLDTEVTYNAIEVIIHRLRKKLEPAGVVVRTIRGLGYLLDFAE